MKNFDSYYLIERLINFSFIFFVFISFYSCEIFTSREAEKPDQPRSNYEVAITPEILIQNFINSFSDKNTQNYLSCLSDSSFSGKQFTFIPAAGSGLTFPFLIDGWNKKSEEQYFNNLKYKIDANLPITLVISNQQLNPLGDSLFFSGKYFINVPLAESSSSNNFQGEVKFKMIRDSRLLWTIYFWQDIKSSGLPSMPSWSELKGLYY